MNIDDEMIEMMKFYEFYKKMKENSNLDQLTNKSIFLDKKTEGAIKEGKNKNKLKKEYKATRPLEKEEYEQIITLCKNGFEYEDKTTNKIKKFRSNPALAFAFALQATLGFRASDIINLKVSDFNNSKFSIKEIKTGKWQNRDLNERMYVKLKEYIIENNLREDDYLYPNKIRNMQQQLKIITTYLNLKNISTHSFRKLFAHTIYEESGYDIELVRHVLNHSDIKTTIRYLGVSTKKLKDLSNKIDFSYAL